MAPWFRLFAGTVVLLVVYFAAPVRADGNLAVRLIVTVLGIGLTVLLIAREIRRVGDAPLWGLAFALVLGILVFAMTDYLIAVSGSGEFEGLQTRLDGLYFAITTLATVGYGDVVTVGCEAHHGHAPSHWPNTRFLPRTRSPRPTGS